MKGDIIVQSYHSSFFGIGVLKKNRKWFLIIRLPLKCCKVSATAQQYVAIYIEEETTQRYFEFVTVKSNESNQIVDFHIM